jgi:RNA polymerase sigma factor (sigma-70 family)
MTETNQGEPRNSGRLTWRLALSWRRYPARLQVRPHVTPQFKPPHLRIRRSTKDDREQLGNPSGRSASHRAELEPVLKAVKEPADFPPCLSRDVSDHQTRTMMAELEGVYEQQGAPLWRAVYLYSGDREVASDAVAEAFAQALRRDNLRSPDRWIWRTAFRVAAGDLAKRRREAHGFAEVAYELPDDTAELLLALPRLSPKQRAAIVLHYQSGYSLKEVAEIIGSTPSAVGVHLHRGRRRLRELL